MLGKVGDPHGVFLIRLLVLDSFDELGMRDNDVGIFFKDVANGEPIVAGGFHADVGALVPLEPDSGFAQIIRIG